MIGKKKSIGIIVFGTISILIAVIYLGNWGTKFFKEFGISFKNIISFLKWHYIPIAYIVVSIGLLLLKKWARIFYVVFHIMGIVVTTVFVVFYFGLTGWDRGPHKEDFIFIIKYFLPIYIYLFVSIFYFTRLKVKEQFKQLG